MARFEEALDVILRAWTSEQRFSHRGRYWQFDDIVVEPPTRQQPHPPIWMAAGSVPSIRKVAARDFNLMLDQFASIAVIGERLAQYRAELEAYGRVFDPSRVCVARDMYVARDEAEKQAAHERSDMDANASWRSRAGRTMQTARTSSLIHIRRHRALIL
jgi:alkanesulfonate monooxygenase SsuD/methylene tetrahydromethanopterin reductase-like flavin-dependent oxidoreductase (luciferase family)